VVENARKLECRNCEEWLRTEMVGNDFRGRSGPIKDYSANDYEVCICILLKNTCSAFGNSYKLNHTNHLIQRELGNNVASYKHRRPDSILCWNNFLVEHFWVFPSTVRKIMRHSYHICL
jgi:hypothetical protein